MGGVKGGETKPSKRVTIERLARALGELDDAWTGPQDLRFLKWQRDTRLRIQKAFGSNGSEQGEFDGISYLPSFTMGDIYDDGQRAFQRGVEEARTLLQSMIDQVAEYWTDEGDGGVGSSTALGECAATRDVFVVHGRDDAVKQSVARFLERLQLRTVILHEEPNLGRTLIEKFEGCSNAGYAVVLLTPDDVGYAVNEGRDAARPRARQNVLLEMGFFLGKLGRRRVCALLKGDLEIPTDYEGVAWVGLDDSGGWKLKLAQEMKHAGMDVDMNLAV